MREDIKNALDIWARTGRLPGDFLQAVLSNDLMDAMRRADNDNRRDIFEICSYIYNKLPSGCHGSREAVKNWTDQFVPKEFLPEKNKFLKRTNKID